MTARIIFEQNFSSVHNYLTAYYGCSHQGSNATCVILAKVISDVRVSLAFNEVMEPTLYVIGMLLDRGVIAGQVEDNAFRIWRMPKDEILARITKEWIELGHDP